MAQVGSIAFALLLVSVAITLLPVALARPPGEFRPWRRAPVTRPHSASSQEHTSAAAASFTSRQPTTSTHRTSSPPEDTATSPTAATASHPARPFRPWLRPRILAADFGSDDGRQAATSGAPTTGSASTTVGCDSVRRVFRHAHRQTPSVCSLLGTFSALEVRTKY